MSLTAIPLPQEAFVLSLLCATVRYVENKPFVLEKDTMKIFCVKEIHKMSVWCGRTRTTV